MNKKIFRPKLYNGLFLGISSLFVIFTAGRSIAIANSAAINSALNISTTGKKNNADAQYYGRDYTDSADVKTYFESVAKEVEGEGLVLLKNANSALPMKTNKKVSLFGTASINFNYNTSGSSSTDSSKYITLQKALENNGFEINSDLTDFYSNVKDDSGNAYGRVTSATLYTINEVPWSKYTDSALNNLPSYPNAIVTFARESGEGKDLSTRKSDGEDESYLSLSNEELDLLKGLTTLKKNHKLDKIIVLLNSSNPIEQDYLYREGIDVDSVLWVGNVGSYGLEAVADVLDGTTNPSGRLSDTYCRDDFSSPAMASWQLNTNKSFASGYKNYKEAELNSTNRCYGVYNEGVYLGYRYYETRYEDTLLGTANNSSYDYSADVAFPFGYGLSYTDFSYSGFKVTESDDKKTYDVEITVNNDGDEEGKHTVELYYQRPYTDYDKAHGIEKPAVELGGFAKTGVIPAHKSETVHVTMNKSQFKTYDADGYKTFILEKGDYYLTIGSNAHTAVNNIALKKNVSASKLIGEGNADFAHKLTIESDDTTSYSKSEYTGYDITNQLDHADMNRYEGKGDNSVTYVSRSNWEGTWPSEKTVFTASEQMIRDLSSHKDLPTDGTMPKYDTGTLDTMANMMDLPFDDPKWDALLDAMSQEDQVKLVTSGQLCTATISSVSLPGTIEKDGPTAVTTTKTDSSFPSEGIWASSFNLELIQKVGDAFAEDIINSDTEGIYAPGVNLHRAPYIGRSNEYFSEDPLLTGKAAAYEIKGLQKKGVMATLKHFAFNDCETERNGIGIWLNEQEARELLLLPFEIAIAEGDSAAIMSSFNRAGCIWTGADANLSINILQKEWGFKGFSITDMAAANGGSYMVYDDGYMGGTNLFMASYNDLSKYRDNAAFCQMVRDSAHRIMYTVCNKSRAMNGLKGDSVVQEVTPYWEILLNVLVITTGILSAACLGMSIASEIILKKDN